MCIVPRPLLSSWRHVSSALRSSTVCPFFLTLALLAFGMASRQALITVLALYQHSTTMEANWMVEAAHGVARLPLDGLAEYGEVAASQPILTKACTSGAAYFLGDMIAQVFEGRRRIEGLDLSRCVCNTIAGFVLHGPALHFWILLMESFIGSTAEWWTICVKIILDQTIFSAVLNMAYVLMLGLLSAKPWDEVLHRARERLAPAMFSSWRFWPFVHLITYSPFMPIDFKVLWNDVMEILWVAILSVIANDEEAAETGKQTDVVAEDVSMEPSRNVALAAECNAGLLTSSAIE